MNICVLLLLANSRRGHAPFLMNKDAGAPLQENAEGSEDSLMRAGSAQIPCLILAADRSKQRAVILGKMARAEYIGLTAAATERTYMIMSTALRYSSME